VDPTVGEDGLRSEVGRAIPRACRPESRNWCGDGRAINGHGYREWGGGRDVERHPRELTCLPCPPIQRAFLIAPGRPSGGTPAGRQQPDEDDRQKSTPHE